MLVPVLFIILGFALLVKGADSLVDGASNIAKKFHIPEIIIGLTIVSIGTSMPELVVSVTSALKGCSDMAMGNVIGSNVCNLLLILGLSTVIKPIKFQKETKFVEIPLNLAFTVLFMILCNSGLDVSKYDAVILMGLFALFIIYTILMAKEGEKNEKDNVVDSIENKGENNAEKSKNNKRIVDILKNILFIIIGVVALKFGGDLTVDNAVIIAKHFNLSEQVISLTILAVGTSLPELVTSVMAAIKGNSDIAIGNIIGSNIFNMLLIIGVASIINPIIYNVAYNMDLIVLMVATVVLFLFTVIPPKNEMNRLNGLIYLLMYGGYIAMLFNV
ncbi:MAG: calcium/sodium antiporter [Clostridia bacterium]|nr:calcium/sodium antiporter [Clostridia bacterium]